MSSNSSPASLHRLYLPLIASAALLLGPGLAVSQTTGYTAKELKPPFGYTGARCDLANRHSLGDNGTVTTMCTYTAGFYFAPQVAAFFPIPYVALRPVTWRNNGASVATLPLPSGYEIKYQAYGVDGTGRVLARIGLIQKPGTPFNPTPDSFVWWDGNTRSTWAPPIPELLNLNQWRLGNVTPSGKVAAFTVDKGAQEGGRIVVISGATVEDLPLPPDVLASPNGDAVLGGQAGQIIFMNDQGQVAVITRPRVNQPSSPESRLWFWNGQSWREITANAPFLSTLQVENITAQGDVMLTEVLYTLQGRDIRRYTWHASSGVKTVANPESTAAQSIPPQQLLEDGATVAGQTQFLLAPNHPRTGRNRAALFRDGRATDLNSLVPPPSGYVFYEVLDVNTRGQLLVRMLNTDRDSYKPRLWLFTPR